jgi:hypothetical protein
MQLQRDLTAGHGAACFHHNANELRNLSYAQGTQEGSAYQSTIKPPSLPWLWWGCFCVLGWLPSVLQLCLHLPSVLQLCLHLPSVLQAQLCLHLHLSRPLHR